MSISSTEQSLESSPAGTDPELKQRIATFYDQSSPLWEDVWGEHMHMGECTSSPCCTLPILLASRSESGSTRITCREMCSKL